MARKGRPRKKIRVNPQELVVPTKYPVHYGQVRLYEGNKKSFEFEHNHPQYDRFTLMDKLERFTGIKMEDVMEIIHYGTRTTVTNTDNSDEHQDG